MEPRQRPPEAMARGPLRQVFQAHGAWYRPPLTNGAVANAHASASAATPHGIPQLWRAILIGAVIWSIPKFVRRRTGPVYRGGFGWPAEASAALRRASGMNVDRPLNGGAERRTHGLSRPAAARDGTVLPRASAARSVFCSRQAIVMGPTPPGTGVI